MFFGHNTKAALVIETTTDDGAKQTLIYRLAEPITIDIDWDLHVNLFDGLYSQYRETQKKISIDAYLGKGRLWDHEFPGEQAEIEPANLAIESNDGDIVYETDEQNDW